jgi:CelD/BcsL family acetyltransferase involved in cellulose biosynthesis
VKLQVRAPSPQLAREWDALADGLAVVPFLRPGWITAWSRAFAPEGLRLLCARRDSELVGLVPFLEHRGVVRSPTNWHTPVFGWLARDDEVRAVLAANLVARVRTRLDLSFLDADDPMLAAIQAAARATGRRTISRAIMHSPYVMLEGTDWGSYRASLSRSTRREAERLLRRLGEKGDVQVEFGDGDRELETLLTEGFALESSGWKRQRGTAIESDRATRDFYAEVAAWAHERGELLLAFLRLGDRAIAFDLCLEATGATYVLKGGFDPELRRFGPGMVLTYESLKRGFERGTRSYELLGDADRYKLAWTRHTRQRCRLQVFGKAPSAYLNRLAWSYGRGAYRGAEAFLRRLQRDRPGR